MSDLTQKERPAEALSSARPAIAARRSLAASAYRRLKADILACRLLPGAMLAAAELAERFEMSRTPVHEALKALCQEGLLRVMPRIGYIVTPVSVGDIQEIFDLRLSLEVLGAGLAAERATSSDVAALREQHQAALANLGSAQDPSYLESLIAGNREFHVFVAALSGNQRLARMVRGLLDEGQRIYFLYFRSGRTTAGDPHDDVIRALAASDPQGARQAMADHIRDQREGTLSEAAVGPG
jgi:DNA-binding GntR family transcriptional regulator